MRLFGLAATIASLVLSAHVALAQCSGDFNGDGYDDLAVGVPGEDVAGAANAGAVNVFYGSAAYLSSPSVYSILHQNSADVVDQAEAQDAFGSALAIGDFDGDGYDDLALGVPGEDVGTVNAAGAVQVIYSTGSGLRPLLGGQQFLDSVSLGHTAETNDRFGSALAAGDFDGDGFDDLAVGVPNANDSDIGRVDVLFGSPSGLQESRSLDTSAGAFDDQHFGASLAAGDFNGDGADELVVGIPDRPVSFIEGAGEVRVYAGVSPSGAISGTIWNQNSTGIPDSADANDHFGFAVATGDFDGDSIDDLAIGVPFEDAGTLVDFGVVHVIYGSPSGLQSLGNAMLLQNPGALAESEADDRFGWSLAAGDATADGHDELLVGAPGEDTGMGAVTAFRGRTDGLAFLRIARARVQGGAAAGDAFASALTLGDFNGDGRCDLIVGNRGDDVGSAANAGSVTLLTPQFVQYIHQDVSGVSGAVGSNDGFGSSLSRASR